LNLSFAPSRKLAAHRLAHGGPRIYDPRERALVGGLDLLLRGATWIAGLQAKTARNEPIDVRNVERVLALRLDRLGDLLTTLPALRALRAGLPHARIELGVGSWNEPVARRLPFVDAVRIVDVPWAAWGRGRREAGFRRARRALAGGAFDLALDFQGDVRVVLLMALAGARLRAGYGETGGRYLLTHEGSWDEKRSWYRQNLELVRAVLPGAAAASLAPYNFVTGEDRDEAGRLLREKGIEGRPLIGVQPSAGRAIKEWEPEKFAALIDLIGRGRRATVVLTGAASDEPLVEKIRARCETPPRVLLGVPLATFAAVIERFDVFVTGDTGPMHLSHAVGTPNVAIFGPSDPVRYGPEPGGSAPLRRVVRRPVFCSPCNMIRRPPRECAELPSPECISGITVDDVSAALSAALSDRGL
jgi:ADP-heptose:LPS heptosyltransferase